jgi:hypothetical protein
MSTEISLDVWAKCRKARSTSCCKSVNSGKCLRCVASFLTFFHRSSIGLKSGECYDLHCKRLCQKDLQNPTFGAIVVQIVRLFDLRAVQIIGSRLAAVPSSSDPRASQKTLSSLGGCDNGRHLESPPHAAPFETAHRAEIERNSRS